MLPFEIRDLNYDEVRLATIPQKIGLKYTKMVGVFLLGLIFLLEFFKDECASILILSVVLILTLLFLVLSNKNQSKYYSAFWVESLPILWLVILLMFY